MYCWGWLRRATVRHTYCTVACLAQMLNQVLRVKVQPRGAGQLQLLIKAPRGIKIPPRLRLIILLTTSIDANQP